MFPQAILSTLLAAPRVELAMLSPDFWLERLPNAGQAPLRQPADLPSFNATVYERLNIPPLFELPTLLDKAYVAEQISAYTPPDAPRYDGLGRLVDNAAFYADHLDPVLAALPENITPQYAITTRRTAVRSLPTWDILTYMPGELPIDALQETALDVGQPLAILAHDTSGAWGFALTPLYWGWVPLADLGLTERSTAQAFAEADDFLMTLSNRGLIGLAQGGGLTPQMGTRLPLVAQTDAHFSVQAPTRAADGRLALREGYIHRAEVPHLSQFSVGFQPLNADSLFRAGFALLGERYAWGGARLGIFGRDCSRFLQDIFATTGLYLPRNGDEQQIACETLFNFSPNLSLADRRAVIVEEARAGDILVTPGHIMLYLGHISGEPYILHDAGGAFKCVLVSTLVLDEDNLAGALLQKLTHLVTVRGA